MNLDLSSNRPDGGCKNDNDGPELERSIRDLSQYLTLFKECQHRSGRKHQVQRGTVPHRTVYEGGGVSAMLKDADKKPGVHRGRYNMDFDPVKGDPYGNMQKAQEHIDALKNREREAKEQGI